MTACFFMFYCFEKPKWLHVRSPIFLEAGRTDTLYFLTVFCFVFFFCFMCTWNIVLNFEHRRRSSINFRGHDIFGRKYNEKLSECSNFTSFLPEKLTKFPNFNRFLPENARILHNNCPKNIFPIFFFGGGGDVPPCPPSTMPMISKAVSLSF